MADINTAVTSHQFFSSTGTNTVIFGRSITNLIITVTGAVQMSLDGTNFMTVAAGTHQFLNISKKKILFTGAGTYEGFGIAL